MLKTDAAPPRVLVALLRRLNAPPVATRLSKEELCLSLGAVDKINRSRGHSGDSTGSAWSLPMLHSLKARTLQYLPLCVPREIGMIAGGCQVIRPETSDLADRLVEELYRAVVRDVPVTIADITLVLEAALEHSSEAFNLTLRHLVLEVCPTLLTRSTVSVAVLDRFLCSANVHAARTMDEPQHVRAWYEKVQQACPESNPSLASVVASRAAAAEQAAVGKAKKPAPPASSDDDGHAAGRQQDEEIARHALFAQLVVLESPSAALSSSSSPRTARLGTEELTEMMEVFAFFRWRDPVAQSVLLSEAQAVLRTGSPAEVEQVKRVALLAGTAFQSLFDSAQPHAAASGALSPATAASRAYHMLIDRRVDIPADLLRAVQQEAAAPASSLGEGAMRLHVRQRCVGLSLAELDAALAWLRGAPAPQSLAEVALLTRVARRDDTARLANAVEPVLRRSLLEDGGRLLEHASVAELLALADALCLPAPRSTRFSAACVDTMQAAATAVASTLLQCVNRPTTSAQEVIQLIQRFHALPATTALSAPHRAQACRDMMAVLHTRLQSPSPPTPLPRSVCVAVMRLFTATDVVYEPLMDRIAECVAHDVETLWTPPDDAVEASVRAADLLALAVCQLDLDTPELHQIMWRLMTRVASAPAATDTVSIETVLAALAVAVSPDGKRDCVPVLLARLSHLSLDGASPASLANAVRVLAAAAAAQHAVPGSVVENALACLARCDPDTTSACTVDGTVPWLEAVLLASYALSEASMTMTPALDVVGQAAVRCVTCAAPDAFTRLCRRAPSLSAACAAQPRAAGWVPLLVEALVKGLPSQLDCLSFKQIADCVFSLAQTPNAGQRLSHQVMANAIADYVINAADDLLWSGRDVARLLRGLALLHHTERGVFVVGTRRLHLRPVAATLDQTSAALLFGAMGDARFVDAPLVNRLSRAFTRHAEDLNAADMYLAVCGHSRVLLRNDAFYQAMGDQLAQRPEQFSPDAALNLLSAYATVEQPHDALADVLAAHLVTALPALDANRVTGALTSLWLMDVDVSMNAHARQLASFVASRSSELSSASLVKLCSILRDLQWRSAPLLAAVAQQSIALQRGADVDASPGLTPEQCRIVLDTLGVFLVHAPEVRQLLSESARTVSKDRAILPPTGSGDEPEGSRLDV